MNLYRKLYESQVFDQEWANEVIEWEENLNLEYSKIESLPELKSVGWSLDLENSQIQFLPKLESVGGSLYLENSQVQSLPKLEYVGRSLFLQNSQIQSLPELRSVEGPIYVNEHQYNYWKLHFLKSGRKHLAEKLII